MIWTDKTHFYAATTCRHLGRPCPAAEQMAAKLAEAMTRAKPLTQADFSISGGSELEGCAKGCLARFEASHESIRVFCGAGEDADPAELGRYANAMFRQDGRGFSAAQGGSARPCALIEALPKTAEARDAERMMAF
ncbi:hypothetical protein [Cribrihabitans neustonicus]|uniref:hypothetical protein n=1 Tax=Cribrihabitans neustonicus TaxID=1429085 RepID=UPI003B5C1A7D